MKYYQTDKFKETTKYIHTLARKYDCKYVLIGGNIADIYVNPPITKDIDFYITGSKYNLRRFTEEIIKNSIKYLPDSILGDIQWGEPIFELKATLFNYTEIDMMGCTKPCYDYWIKTSLRERRVFQGVYILNIECLIALKFLTSFDLERIKNYGMKDRNTFFALLKQKHNKQKIISIIEDMGEGCISDYFNEDQLYTYCDKLKYVLFFYKIKSEEEINFAIDKN